MNILVTGSEGYIGTNLTSLLIKKGYSVTGIDTKFYKRACLYAPDAHRKHKTYTEDIRNISTDFLKEFNAVVHLAELSNDSLGELNPKTTMNINYRGSINLAKKCKKAGVKRFIYSSSCSVYGTENAETLTENSKTNPLTVYAKCKLLVEKEVSRLAGREFSPVFLRNATAYGASPRMRFDLVLNNLAGHAWTGKKLLLLSDGTPWRPLVHNLDICEAIILVLEADKNKIHNEVFNVGNNEENYQIKDLAELIKNTFSVSELSLNEKSSDSRSYKVSFDKINNAFPGFRCKHTANDGASELIDLFKKINMTKDTFISSPYTRIKEIKHLIKTKQVDEDLMWIK